ncbi:hypothetical protein Gpo141_00013762, partial [Globisporangium polare]
MQRESEDVVVAHRRGRRQSDDATGQHEHEVSLRVAPSVDEQRREDGDKKIAAVVSSALAPDAKRLRATGGSAPSKILFLDGVRGIASILVVTQHAGYMFGVNLGHCAVDIFFVLSSFLLTWLFYKKSEQLL